MGKKTKTSQKNLDGLSAHLKTKRSRLTLYYRPFSTIYLFLTVCINYAIRLTKLSLTSPWFYLLLLPLTSVYASLKFYNLYPDEISEVDSYLMFASWWIGLGIVSSIGLGTGMHSGMLFLFPHIFSVVSASTHCPSLDFNTICDVWYLPCPMTCQTPASQIIPAPTLLQLVLKVLPACVLWGSGTAVGEIPPYLVSRAAALAGESDPESEEMLKETEGDDAFSKMKKWMVDFVAKHGFMGVLLMSAWPNAAFDLVGICCGQLGVSFYTFFFATLIGKGIIKVSGQALFFCLWFRNPEAVIQIAVDLIQRVNEISPMQVLSAESVKEKLEMALNQVSKGVSDSANIEDGEEQSWLKFVGGNLVLGVMLLFLMSTIQQLAQGKQKEIDEEQLRKLKDQQETTTSTKSTNKIAQAVKAVTGVKSRKKKKKQI